MNPMVDGWIGDDWFHNGAFRQQNMPYMYEQEATRESDDQVVDAATSTTTTNTWRPARPASWGGATGSSRSASGARSSSTRPTTPSGSDQAVDKLLAAEPLTVPVMLVHSLWDQEDIYGAIAVYKALEPKDARQRHGVPRHGPLESRPDDRRRQLARRAAASTATRRFTSAARSSARSSPSTSRTTRPQADVPPVLAFETGTNTWRRLPAWPAGCASGCAVRPTPLYLGAGLGLGFEAAAAER